MLLTFLTIRYAYPPHARAHIIVLLPLRCSGAAQCSGEAVAVSLCGAGRRALGGGQADSTHSSPESMTARNGTAIGFTKNMPHPLQGP